MTALKRWRQEDQKLRITSPRKESRKGRKEGRKEKEERKERIEKKS